MRLTATLLACLLAPAAATAQVLAPGMGGGWTGFPAVTILSDKGDPRLPLVVDAVAFWNRTLIFIGSSFRLGAITVVDGRIPADELARLSATAINPHVPIALPDDVAAVPGNLIVALSEGNFVSFSLSWRAAGKDLVAIKTALSPPLDMPNVARNVIAHELGHALGLGHNSDPAMLMCGRPAPCRPNLFAAADQHYFPLTDGEKAHLLRLYPIDWRPK